MTKLFNNTVSKADIMKRAHELARMNGKTGPHARPFGFWLKMAWSEAREGRTQFWLWLSDGRMLAHLENAYEAARAEFRSTDELFAQISALRAKIAAANTAPVELPLAA